jgi:outer membrane protein OmpA-like peptidoglycan-associated protein
MKRSILFGAALLVACSLLSQTRDRKWNIGLHGGLTQYNGDKGQNFYATDQAAYAFASVSVSRFLGKHFDASLFLTRGELGNVEPRMPWSLPNENNHFLIRLNTANLVLRYNILSDRFILRPYIYAGAGVIMHEKYQSVKDERYDYALPSFGGGLNIRITPVISLQLQESFMYTTADDIDGDVKDYNDGYLYHTAGLTFNLGKKKDEDKDGVADRNDKCPGTPPGVVVDKNGCPLDRDFDGVADYIDDCPDAAGTAALKGCPDKDGDGIADKEDRCPDIAGTLAMKGCPDTDKDGIVDIDDKCPDTKPNYKVDATGCTLDNDKDGLVNEEDLCPDLAGPLALKGCPDTDGDGVSDLSDRCPNVKGTIANKGCPEMAQADVKRIAVIASKIFFETNSAKLKAVSNAQLDGLVDILKRNDAVSLTIEGHTDNVGNDDYNMELSQKRTESVKAYLESKGIPASRLNAIGYGETQPIGDNTKAAGRSQNRRVELKTAY